jgi:hypothetical protein
MTSEPAAPYAELILLLPRYKPIRNFPIGKKQCSCCSTQPYIFPGNFGIRQSFEHYCEQQGDDSELNDKVNHMKNILDQGSAWISGFPDNLRTQPTMYLSPEIPASGTGGPAQVQKILHVSSGYALFQHRASALPSLWHSMRPEAMRIHQWIPGEAPPADNGGNDASFGVVSLLDHCMNHSSSLFTDHALKLADDPSADGFFSENKACNCNHNNEKRRKR